METINILIVGDHKLIRETWSFILSKDPTFRIVAECDSSEAIGKAKQLRPNMVIMDINLSGINGTDVTNQIRKFLPGSKIMISNCSEIYHSVFERAAEAMVVTDFNGNLKEINSSFCAMLGYTKEELLQLNVRKLMDPEELEVRPIRFDLLALGENILNERKMVHKNGTVIYVDANAKKIIDNCILGIARDITEQKKVQDVLQKSEANLHTIFDTTDTIYILMDNELRIISYNPRAVDFAKKELQGSIELNGYFVDHFPPDRQPALLIYIKEALTGKHINYEISYPQADGSLNWYYVRMFPISKGGKKIYGLMVEVNDITQNKLLEQELLARKVQEQKNITRAVLHAQEIERNRIGQELHDNVNQILATIKLYITMIEHDQTTPGITERAKEFIDIAIREIRVLSREQVTPHKKFDLKGLIEDLILDLNTNTRANTKFQGRVTGTLTIDEDLKLNIYRIVQEQVNNILKYAAASTASISVVENNGIVNISIIDDGKGFDPWLKRKGIGISNMINRVESYNGEISIESSPGKGCKIEITIPH